MWNFQEKSHLRKIWKIRHSAKTFRKKHQFLLAHEIRVAHLAVGVVLGDVGFHVAHARVHVHAHVHDHANVVDLREKSGNQ